MISIILFILIGIKLEMGAAYYCIIGLRAGLLIGKMTMKAIERYQKKRLLKELGESLDGLIDDLEKAKEKAEKREKREKEEKEENAEEYGFCELKDTENWEPACKAGVWEIDKERKAKVDREQNENQEEIKHE